MVEIARRILKYKVLKGNALYAPGLEAEIQMINDINNIALGYVTEAQARWKQETREPSG